MSSVYPATVLLAIPGRKESAKTISLSRKTPGYPAQLYVQECAAISPATR